jgi:putative FmdB family regulatory protein
MPIYEYKCKKCSKKVEELQGYNDPAPECKECKEAMVRLISQPSFHLKGSGWYKDHYGLKKEGTSNEK